MRLALAFAAVVLATPALAQPMCEELWAERNGVYAEAGYCFKTERAIRAFGNGNCRYENAEELPLSQADRRRVAEIQREERRRGCPR